MRRSLALLPVLVGLLACQDRPAAPVAPAAPSAPDPSVPRPAPIAPLTQVTATASDVPPGEPRGLVGPRGTLEVEVYRKRRRALMDQIKTGAAVIDAGWDAERDRVLAGFYYLTGVEEKGAALGLAPQTPLWKEVLFLKSRDVETERWDGDRAGLPSRELEVATGIGRIDRDAREPGFLTAGCARWNSLTFVGDYVPAPREKPREMTLYGDAVSRAFECRVTNLHGAISRMRLVKEPAELALMRKAIASTAAGHAAALAVVRPGVREFEVKQALEDAFRRAGSRRVAFPSIVGSGPNSAVLHYPEDDREMKAGELVVIDIGAEIEHYAADITRTLPVGGKYSADQREVYDIVLRAQAAGIAAARAGVSIEAVNVAVHKVIEDAGYYDYFPHGCCHTVGLDVHDGGDPSQPLPAGAVITVEPGIYLPQRGFGIRIEDEVLITASGAELLTGAIPKDPAELERLMAARKAENP